MFYSRTISESEIKALGKVIEATNKMEDAENKQENKKEIIKKGYLYNNQY